QSDPRYHRNHGGHLPDKEKICQGRVNNRTEKQKYILGLNCYGSREKTMRHSFLAPRFREKRSRDFGVI
ncbi:MAG: hypothetical protein J6033_03895, partial [Lachnospiraceae bacterium]|nr:hypothetical protein [Lachnospiraceae bacterium]